MGLIHWQSELSRVDTKLPAGALFASIAQRVGLLRGRIDTIKPANLGEPLKVFHRFSVF